MSNQKLEGGHRLTLTFDRTINKKTHHVSIKLEKYALHVRHLCVSVYDTVNYYHCVEVLKWITIFKSIDILFK